MAEGIFGKSDLLAVGEELKQLGDAWVVLNDRSRILIKKTKQLIYALHREDFDSADKLMSELEESRKKLRDAACMPKLIYSGPVRIAEQEYVEAACYLKVLKESRLPGMGELGVSAETYVLGLSDLTGELMRKCIYYMIHEDFEGAVFLKEAVSEIYSSILSLDLPTGETRKKADQIKYNLAKMEQSLFEAKIRDKM